MKPVNLKPVTGHVVREDASRSPVPEGKGLYVIAPSTAEVWKLKPSQVAQAEAYAATRKRAGRGRMVNKGRW